MNKAKMNRITRTLSTEKRARLQQNRSLVAGELADLVKRDRMAKEASDEPTLSGELRRAVHASPLSLADIAGRSGISAPMLDEFLTGERTLRSDVLDRLAASLGFALTRRG